MRRSRIANLIDTLHDGVEGCVVTDGRVSAAKVVVDGGWDGDTGNVVFLCKDTGSVNRAVTTDDDKRIDFLALKVLKSTLTTFFTTEVLAGRRLQDGTALLDDVADVLGLKLDDVAVDESLIATHDGLDAQSVIDGRTCDGTDGTVHAWCVVARCDDCDSFHVISF